MTIELNHLLTIVRMIAVFVENSLGGKVVWENEQDKNGVILSWKRYDVPTNKMLRYKYKITYEELENIKEPFAFGKVIVDSYKEQQKNGKN